MPHIFITAFEPYDHWTDNASWLALVEFTRELPSGAKFTTRRYPVDFPQVRERLERDLQENFDYVLHLGQAPGSSVVRLETIGINIGGRSDSLPESFQPLVSDGPVAYRSSLPLAQWSAQLRDRGIPASVSYHAGTFLCNATLYLTHHISQQNQLRTQTTFIHLPLATSQTVRHAKDLPSLPVGTSAAALRIIVDELIKRELADAPTLA